MSKVGGAGHEGQDQESPFLEDAHDVRPADNVVGQYKHHPGQNSGKNKFRLKSDYGTYKVLSIKFLSELSEINQTFPPNYFTFLN